MLAPERSLSISQDDQEPSHQNKNTTSARRSVSLLVGRSVGQSLSLIDCLSVRSVNEQIQNTAAAPFNVSF